MADNPPDRFGVTWRPARGRCFHPTGEVDESGHDVCCPHAATVRGHFLAPYGTAYVVDACAEHAHRLRQARPLT